MRNTRTILFICIICSLPLGIGAFEPPDLTTHLEIRQAKESKPPYFSGNNCIITYKAEHPVRYVGAAFEHENFSTIHPFVKNEYGTFLLIYPIEPNTDLQELQYRIVVDGLWMADPKNHTFTTDANGIRLSRINVPDRLSDITDNPITDAKGTTRFVYKGPTGRNVYLVGDFNNWDPFMHRMREYTPGLYELRIRVLPGDHFYYYLSNGLKVLDPLNSNRGLDFEGDEASYFAFNPEEME